MCGLVMTLAETEWMPRSTLYIAIGCDLQEALAVERVAVKAGYVETSSTVIKITDDGRALARKLEAEVERKRAEQA